MRERDADLEERSPCPSCAEPLRIVPLGEAVVLKCFGCGLTTI